MSKAVLFSIKPKYCELIASGKKTIEVRKTRPKIDTPFKGYIYCTKQGKLFIHGGIGEKECLFKNPDTQDIKFDFSFELMCCKNKYTEDNFLSGKVIGEFVCKAILPISITYSDPNSKIALREFPFTCLTDKEIMDYLGNGKTGYGFCVSDLVIYDKPKDLDEFMAFGKSNCDCKNCNNCLYMGIDGVCDIKDISQPLFRPPQSWCYVEELR